MTIVLDILEAHADLVEKGVRPAAMEALQDRYLEGARQVAESHGLLLRVSDLAEGWKEVWIYKYPHVGLVIDKVEKKPATGFEHWVLGKLFGYSEEAIAGYVVKQGLLLDLDEAGPVAARAGRERVGGLVEVHQLAALAAPIRSLARFLAGGRHEITSFQPVGGTTPSQSLATPPDKPVRSGAGAGA